MCSRELRHARCSILLAAFRGKNAKRVGGCHAFVKGRIQWSAAGPSSCTINSSYSAAEMKLPDHSRINHSRSVCSIAAAFRQHADDLIHYIITEAGSAGAIDSVVSFDLLTINCNNPSDRDTPSGTVNFHVQLPV